ncbi:MAG: saccharopine dehydrogenase NADP-binding domain-containing protein, partial [Rhodoferax sp.]|nr:saccharopine dehydrogenase NADP-binding domain-containing protein [Rhodoferax sp.]
MSQKEFDIVVHGATGFTGRLVIEYLLQRYPAGSGVRWAMGGRSADKLAQVRDALQAPADTPLVVTDSADAASLDALLARTRLVLTTVGPYQLYGNELVAACARAGVDYVDLCGEPAWMRAMIDAFEPQAKASGARIVFSCGFDSIPFDLGVAMVQEEMQAQFGTPANRVRGRVRRMKGTFSGGTAASLKATMAAAAKDPGVLALLRNPFSLTPGFEGPRQPSGNK